MNPKQEIEQLTRELEYHNRQYYVLDDPKVDDYTYDHMLRRLEDLEKEYPQYASPTSPTRRVGGEAISAFQKVQHVVPLESLQDVFSLDELREFDARVRAEEPEAEYSVEPKVDGLSVALEYLDGVFTRGATRGDGLVGEDVTENLKTIHSIPMRLEGAPPRLIVRGEVFMPRASFEALNAQQEQAGTRKSRPSAGWTFWSSTYSLPRGAHSGRTVRRWTICEASASRSSRTRSAATWTGPGRSSRISTRRAIRSPTTSTARS